MFGVLHRVVDKFTDASELLNASNCVSNKLVWVHAEVITSEPSQSTPLTQQVEAVHPAETSEL
jgi:hypothetical protein